MNNTDLQIDWLRTFVTVVDAGSLTTAAPLLHRSQSAVSMQIKKLEETLGRQVLHRSPRHIDLTKTGKELLTYARRMLELQLEAKSALFGPQLKGQIKIGVPEDYVSHYLVPILRQFSNQYPDVDIDLVCEQSTTLIPLIARNELDIAIASSQASHQGQLLFEEPLVWVGSPRYEVWKKSPLPIAVYEAGSMARKETVSALKKLGRPYRIVYHSASVAGQLAAVESGLAVAVLTRCCVNANCLLLRDLTNGYRLPEPGRMEVSLFRSSSSADSEVVGVMESLLTKNLKH